METKLPFQDFIERMDKADLKSEYHRATHDLAGFIQGHHQEIEKRYDAYPKLVEAVRMWRDAIEACNLRDGWAPEMQKSDALLRELGEAS